jgi:hypothetical protein
MIAGGAAGCKPRNSEVVEQLTRTLTPPLNPPPIVTHASVKRLGERRRADRHGRTGDAQPTMTARPKSSSPQLLGQCRMYSRLERALNPCGSDRIRGGRVTARGDEARPRALGPATARGRGLAGDRKTREIGADPVGGGGLRVGKRAGAERFCLQRWEAGMPQRTL